MMGDAGFHCLLSLGNWLGSMVRMRGGRSSRGSGGGADSGLSLGPRREMGLSSLTGKIERVVCRAARAGGKTENVWDFFSDGSTDAGFGAETSLLTIEAASDRTLLTEPDGGGTINPFFSSPPGNSSFGS